jgi:hypothetical protein
VLLLCWEVRPNFHFIVSSVVQTVLRTSLVQLTAGNCMQVNRLFIVKPLASPYWKFPQLSLASVIFMGRAHVLYVNVWQFLQFCAHWCCWNMILCSFSASFISDVNLSTYRQHVEN